MIIEIKELGIEFNIINYEYDFELFIKSISLYLVHLNIDKSKDKHRLKNLVETTPNFRTFKYYNYTFLVIKK